VGVAKRPFLPRYRAYAVAVGATIFSVVMLFVLIMEATRR